MCTFVAGSAPYVKFVQENVLPGIATRRYARPEQQWELALESLKFLKASVSTYINIAQKEGFERAQKAEAAHYDRPRDPATLAQLGFLNDVFQRGGAFQALMHPIMQGVDRLQELRSNTRGGVLAEQTVDEVLQLLLLVMRNDASILQAMKGLSKTDTVGFQPLSLTLKQDEIMCLMEYALYPYLPNLQMHALQIAIILEEQRDDFVSLLMTPSPTYSHPVGLTSVQYL